MLLEGYLFGYETDLFTKVLPFLMITPRIKQKLLTDTGFSMKTQTFGIKTARKCLFVLSVFVSVIVIAVSYSYQTVVIKQFQLPTLNNYTNKLNLTKYFTNAENKVVPFCDNATVRNITGKFR